MTAPIRLVALGNPVMSDDGAGPAILNTLRKNHWPLPVEYYSAGTASLSLWQLLREPGAIFVIDALKGGYKPGTVYHLRCRSLSLSHTAFSLHDMHFLHLASRFFPHRLTDIHVFAVEPYSLEPGLSLSVPVTRALPLLQRVVTRWLVRMSR